MAASKKTVVADRKTTILDAGANLAAKYGTINVTRRMVAKAAKVSEALVSSYMGNAAEAQKKYKARAKKLGLTLPTAAEAEAKGVKLRAHGPRKAPVVRRKRSAKEIEAIKRNIASKEVKVVAKKSRAGAECASKVTRSATISQPELPKQINTAARAPKAPPTKPELPALPLALPALPL